MNNYFLGKIHKGQYLERRIVTKRLYRLNVNESPD